MGQNDEQVNEMTQNGMDSPVESRRISKKEPNMSKSGGPAQSMLGVKTNMVDKTMVALTSPFSGELEHLSKKVKSMMEKTANATADGRRRLYVCKVCGKEGQSIDVQKHIEANHLEGISIPCNMCDKSSRSRSILSKHKIAYHTEKL